MLPPLSFGIPACKALARQKDGAAFVIVNVYFMSRECCFISVNPELTKKTTFDETESAFSTRTLRIIERVTANPVRHPGAKKPTLV
jgi:hypothetical protein